MTNEEKKLWGVIGIIAIVLLFLAFRKTSVINNTTETTSTPSVVDIPSVSLPPRTPIVISGLPTAPIFDFSMISACACGGSSVPLYNQDTSSITLNQTYYTTQQNYAPDIDYSGGSFVQPSTDGYYDFGGNLHSYANGSPKWW